MKSFALALLLLTAPAVRAGAAGRAVWVWEPDSYAMLESGSEAKKAAAFLKAKGITAVYLYADAYRGRNLLEQKPRLYRRLIRRLRAEGISTYALLGSYYLKTEEYVLPERHAAAEAMLGRVLRYNAACKPQDRFDGVNLDIEPHLLAEWKDGKERLLLGFLEMSRKLMALKKASGLTLPVGPAIPFWFDGVSLEWNGAHKPVSEHVIDIYDYTALMAYRDRAEGRDGMISHAASEVEYAGKTGRTVLIGVETKQNEIKKVSFYGRTEKELERELGSAENYFGGQPAFAGFVIHHYRSYRNWLESQTPKN